MERTYIYEYLQFEASLFAPIEAETEEEAKAEKLFNNPGAIKVDAKGISSSALKFGEFTQPEITAIHSVEVTAEID